MVVKSTESLQIHLLSDPTYQSIITIESKANPRIEGALVSYLQPWSDCDLKYDMH